MKMIIAINNKKIEEMLTEKYKRKYEIIIIQSTDLLIELMDSGQKNIVILREDLKGENSFLELVKQIRDNNKENTIVAIVKKLNDELKEKLFAKEVFNIIEGNNFLFEDLIDVIENPKIVIYKTQKEFKKRENIIFVTGSRGVGKTFISKTLGKRISKNNKVLVIDLDVIYPTLDTILNIPKNYSIPDWIKDGTEEKYKRIESYESVDIKNDKLRYLLNSKPITIPSDMLIVNLIKRYKSNFDYIIIDTSTMMMSKILNIATLLNAHVILLIEPTKRGVRNFKIDTLYVDKEQLNECILVINKVNSLRMRKKIKNELKIEVSGYVYKHRIKFLNLGLKGVYKKINLKNYSKIKRIMFKGEK